MSKSRVDQTVVKVTPSSGISTQSAMNKVGFLIEGFRSCNDTSRFPDIGAAINLATVNGCEYFDSISSFDSEHIVELLKNKSENDQKSIILTIFLLFAEEANPADIIEKILKSPYRDLLSSGVIKELPKWLNNLNPFTINSFAEEVLKTVFSGDINKFKEYRISLNQEMARISDEISMSKFLSHINRRPDLTTIYGLVGKSHLNMLNEIGTVVVDNDNYRLMRIRASGRTIDVHLYGGKHGEMEHFDLLAKHVKSRGLTVPELPKTEKKADVDLVKLLLQVLASTKSPQPRDSFFEGHRRKDPMKVPEKEKQYTVTQLAEKYDNWMKKYTGHDGTHNQELVDWLSADSGAKYVKNYNQFCEVAAELAKKGYKTNPPPTEKEFISGATKYQKVETLRASNRF